MEELVIIAGTHYEASPKDVRDKVDSFFKRMDKNGDGRVDLYEFLELMNEERVAQHYRTREFFKAMDRDGDGHLDFDDVKTVHYIISSGRPCCTWCLTFIPGMYFCCNKCSVETYTLCLGCYLNKAYAKHVHYGDEGVLFLDSNSLHRPSISATQHRPTDMVKRENTNAAETQALNEPPPELFTWTIENFSKLTAEKLYSETFTFDDYKWRVLIYPKGNNKQNLLSFYLGAADSNTLPNGWSKPVKFSLTVVDQKQPKFNIGKETHHTFDSNESDWGFPSFMPLSDIHDHHKGYLVNDTLVIEALVSRATPLDLKI